MMSYYPCHVLLVEDNPGDARLVEEYLQESPDVACDLARAETVAAARDLLRQERFDLIMSDLGLPDSQGINTFHQLNEVAPDTPIIILTGLGDREVALACLREGAQDYINKNDMSTPSLGKAVRYALERWQSQQALKASEEKFNKVFHHSPVWVVISLLEDGTYLEVNEAFLAGVGYTRDEVLGKSSLELGVWSSESERREIVNLIKQKGSVSNREIVRHTKDGSELPTLYSGELLEIDGRICLVSVEQDISALKKAEAERLKIEQQLLQVQKLESLGVLAGGIAHDFNNMLMGILGNAELARMDLSPESPVGVYFEQIETAARRLADLTNQLLAYSGRGRFVVKAINLSSLVTELSSLLNTVISKQAQVRLNLDENLPSVQVDVTQMRQVIMNLITNASDALQERNGTITICTGTTMVDRDYLASTHLEEDLPTGTYVYLEVSDTGVGMDLETQEKIFDPFFTTKFTGRGLGLAAVQGIIRSHNGTIKVYSEPGKGTAIKVLLPISQVAVQSIAESLPTDGDLSKPIQVLLVDDDETVRKVTCRSLEKMGCRVLTAQDGVDGLNLFRKHLGEMDLVVLDMTMPRLSGEETFQQLRRLKPSVKVLLTSGYNEQESTNRFTGKGLAGFIQKPFTPTELRRKMRDILPEKF
ncbi:MAG: response regulator [Deltaproteobacteria bacterium]|nr:response regulator [Deltaproteobacteria bacterium]